MSNEKKRKIEIVMWFSWLIVLFTLQQAIFMHVDDWGYVSLRYGGVLRKDSLIWNIPNFFKYLGRHYMNWGGRILYYGIFIVFARAGEGILQIFQALVLFGIIYVSYHIVKKEKHDLYAGLLSISVFALIGHRMANDGIYWYAASAGYIWPFLAFYMLILLLQEERYKDHYIIACFFAFATGFSHEQIAVGLCVLFLVFILARKFNHKEIKSYLPIAITGCLGAFIEILAPGNYSRKATNDAFNSLSLFGKIRTNLPDILNNHFDIDQWGWILVCILFSYIVLHKTIKSGKVKVLWFGVNSLFVAGIILAMFQIMPDSFAIIIRLGFVSIICISVLRYYWIKQNYLSVGVFSGAICTQAMLILAPTVNKRVAIPFIMLMNICIVEGLVEFVREKKAVCGILLSVIILPITVYQFSTLVMGYYQNKRVNEINHSKLYERSMQIKAGNKNREYS